MLKNTKYLLVLGLCVLFFSCQENTKTPDKNSEVSNLESKFLKISPEEKLWGFGGIDKNGYKYGESDLVLSNGKTINLLWEIYQNNIDKSTISLPSNWIIKTQNNTFFFAKPFKERKDFLIWKKYSKAGENISLPDFAKYFHDVITTDTIEVCKNPSIDSYKFNTGQTGYYFNCQMTKDSVTSTLYSFITEDEQNIHELSLKVFRNTDPHEYKSIFEIIVDNIYLDKNKLMGSGRNVPQITKIEFGTK